MLNLADIKANKNEIYLDNNATTAVLPQAAQAAMHTMSTCFGNPSSSHSTGIQAKYILESTRQLARQVIGADDGDIIFTSGATEGIQTSIISALAAIKQGGMTPSKPLLLYGATEHKAVPETLKHWNDMLEVGAEVVAIPVDENGLLDHQFIAEHIADTVLICTMIANNETGVFQDMLALEEIIRKGNPEVLWMVDCVQGLGKIKLNLSSTTIDYAPFSGHKLYAPKGIGMLYVRQNAPYTPFIAGGGQEQGLRSGTENLPGIAALRAIFELMLDSADETFKTHQQLVAYRQQLAKTLGVVFPAIVFNHDFNYSLPTTLNFSVKGLSSKEIMDVFDAANIRVSSGSACSSKVTGSFVLDAMGKAQWQSEGAIRMSFGPATTQQDIDRACAAIFSAGVAMRQSGLLTPDPDNAIDSKFEGLQQWVYNNQCTWCYIDQASKQVVIIDAVAELNHKLRTLIESGGYHVRAILTTHQHDLQVSNSELTDLLAPMSEQTPVDAHGWPIEQSQTLEFDSGVIASMINLGSKRVIKLQTPGHTHDSVSYFIANNTSGAVTAVDIDYAFTGDTIQIGGIGRSDFTDSDSGALFDSLQMLYSLVNNDTLLCPAHDYKQLFTTSFALEMAESPLLADVCLQRISKEQFVDAKAQVDQQIAEQLPAHYCGYIQQSTQPCVNIAPEQLNDFLAEHDDVLVIDVREAYEFEAHQQTQLKQKPLVNVPLSQLTHFVRHHMPVNNQQTLVCICRSGNRSDTAAKMLKRMNFNRVYHVPGGFALIH
ncbi:aminotransferase class V-fold PLP-dependent enzyme [Thalassotalea ponticola]|uniref:aminotransferase class V-fold PLP-dependent enzyme n=1 Tax=Thalassotalea ponticola TaxID=1523392 RepID=UPI0025B369F3|nr:aminotransferase class V-fold PLP-dependent enzyme [Thalassotalea ponticola]MDN3652079.1 aminotransferase class V-fold PLP-dependent enzyme [Thalassotalea ponticola]